MKVNDPNLSTADSVGAARASETTRASTAKRAATSGAANKSSNDDVHLSELVRSLRSLASDSPERQAQIEHLTRAYATGDYKIDAEATATAIIHDSIHDSISDSISDSTSDSISQVSIRGDSISGDGSSASGKIKG